MDRLHVDPDPTVRSRFRFGSGSRSKTYPKFYSCWNLEKMFDFYSQQSQSTLFYGIFLVSGIGVIISVFWPIYGNFLEKSFFIFYEMMRILNLTKLFRSNRIRNYHTGFNLSFENYVGMILFFRSKMKSLWRPWTSMWKLWQRRKRGPIQKKSPSTLNPGRWKKRFQNKHCYHIQYIKVVLGIFIDLCRLDPAPGEQKGPQKGQSYKFF